MPRCGIARFAFQQQQMREISAGSFWDNLPGAESRSGGFLELSRKKLHQTLLLLFPFSWGSFGIWLKSEASQLCGLAQQTGTGDAGGTGQSLSLSASVHPLLIAPGSAAAPRDQSSAVRWEGGWCWRECVPDSPAEFQVLDWEFRSRMLCLRNELKKLKRGWLRPLHLWYLRGTVLLCRLDSNTPALSNKTPLFSYPLTEVPWKMQNCLLSSFFFSPLHIPAKSRMKLPLF